MGPVMDLKSNYEVVAGTGTKCIPGGSRDRCGDGGLAVEARLSYPKGGRKNIFKLNLSFKFLLFIDILIYCKFIGKM